MLSPFENETKAWWIESNKAPDTYAAFRGTFEMGDDSTVSMAIFGAHFFVAWLDGQYLTEGPYRFPISHPEFEKLTIPLKKGRHVIAAVVRNEGIETRILQSQVIPPFFMAQISGDGGNIPITWKAAQLPGYIPSGQRVSPQFAWIEWVDTRLNPHEWQLPEFDDAGWKEPVEVAGVREWNLQQVDAERIKKIPISPNLIGEGNLSGPFEHKERPGWQTDDGFPWYRRDLAPAGESNGVWRRYDLGHVKLGTPELSLDLPAGVIVEIAYCETLRNGRVTPFIPLSLGPTRNMDHFVSGGGRQTFSPIVPKGGRYLEVHVGAPSDQVRFLGMTYSQRTYYDVPVGEFDCGDEVLNRIWQLGIDTLRGCSEDAITDNPTRERGQWTGDVLLSLYIASAAFNDVRLFKRGLRHSAYCARADGLVAGLAPGGPGYLSTYSAQWTTAVVNFYTMTGDRSVLDELYPYAVKNMDVFVKELTPEGVRNFEWPFVDWGYPGCDGSSTEMGVNLHVLEALRNMQAWSGLLNKDEGRYREAEVRLQAAIESWLQPRLDAKAWESVDFYCATLALRNGLVPDHAQGEAIAYMKQHILSCFPNNPGAESLSNPDFRSHRLITPYFAYYSMVELAQAGEIDFVLGQFRTCWGWSLIQGLTTQPEVFDLNWSHCHVWASSPTAQLTRWLLGLQAHFSEGQNHFDFTLSPGSVDHASGKIPFVGQSGAISVSWRKVAGNGITYEIDTPRPIWIHFSTDAAPVTVEGRQRIAIQLPD